MQENNTSRTIEEKMNTMLDEILEHFQLDYISDMHIQFYRDKIIQYIQNKQLETTDYELYKRLITYMHMK